MKEIKHFIAYIIGAVFMSAPLVSEASEPDSVVRRDRSGACIVAAAASSVAVNAAITELLKGAVHEMRPDRTGNNSFPSRHTSWAFTASSVISRSLYRHSPWWSVGAQTLASSVGLQRVRASRHYGSDVVSGAVLGIASAEMAYWLTDKFFRQRALPRSYDNDFRPGLAVTSEAVYTFSDEVRTGFGIVFRGQLPLSEHWGAVMSLRTSSAPVKSDAGSTAPCNAGAATVGGTGHFRLPAGCLAVETSLQAGAVRLERTAGYCAGRYAFEADCDVALSWRLTDKFAVRASAGYRLISHPEPASAVIVGLGSVALF